MRSEWVPFSAGALVTGVMALVLAQMLNPAGSDQSPTAQLVVAADSDGRWLAMSLLYFAASAAMILGMPSVLTLFTGRGRALGLLGVIVFSVGCLGVAGLSALMLMFRALAIEAATRPDNDVLVEFVGDSLTNLGLQVSLAVWVYGFLVGVLLIALGLFRARLTPVWVPMLLLAFLGMQVVLQAFDDAGKVLAAIGLLLLAAGFTGIATHVTAPGRREYVAGSMA